MTAIFVINLASSTERLNHVSQELKAQNLPFERINAVDGGELSESAIAQHYSADLNLKKYHKPLSKGEIGCYLSHRKAWQTIVARQLDYAIILEDDFVLDRSIHSAIENINSLKQPWQLIKLAAYKDRNREIAFTKPLADEQHLVIHKKLMSGCCATAVSLAGAKALLKATATFGRPVDCDLQHVWETGVYGYSLLPYPVSQPENSQSDIRDRSNKVKKSFWRRKKQQLYSALLNTKYTKQFVKAQQTPNKKKGAAAPLLPVKNH
jgi:glycosyl transferase family 25